MSLESIHLKYMFIVQGSYIKPKSMKKILLMIVLGLGLNMNAQTDSYFIFNYEHRETDNEEWSQILLLPDAHGLHYNYPADVALDNGLIILVGMVIIYGIMIKNDKKI